MQDQPTNASDDQTPPSGWLTELQAQLGERVDTLREALADVAAICWPSPPTAFWSHRNDPEQKVTVFVLASGVLHRVRGDLDPGAEASGVGGSSTCEHRMEPITTEATYELTVTSTDRTNDTRDLTRRWRFEIGQLGILEIEFSKARARGPDPTPLARALAMEIARAHAKRAGER